MLGGMNTRALTPDDLPRIAGVADRAAMQSLTRACLATGLRALSRSQYGATASKILAEDKNADLLTRAATSPATLAGTPALQNIALAFVEALQPVSAASALIARSLQLQWDNNAEIRIPNLTVPQADWVAEGGPIPVQQQLATTSAALDPYKLAVLITLTGEMMRSSNAEAMVRATLLANVGPSLDAKMFNANAGVPGLSPPGLLHGVAAITGTAGGGLDAISADVAALADALAPVAGNGGIVLVAAVKQSSLLAMLLPGGSPFPILASSALAAGTVVAVATQALATIVSAPQIDASPNALYQEQTAPTTGGVMAGSPVRSLFQTDSIGLRFKLPCSWAMRGAGVAFITGTSW